MRPGGKDGAVLAVLAQVAGDAQTAQLLVAIVSIVLGVLILIVPRLLNYIVAAYLIVIGVIWLVDAL